MVPLLLKGNEKLGIDANPKAMKVLEDVKNGDKAACAALEYLRQPERRRIWGMLTQRQRRLAFVVGGVAAYPVLVATGIVDPGDLNLGAMLGAMLQEGSGSGSWYDDEEVVPSNVTYDANGCCLGHGCCLGAFRWRNGPQGSQW